LRDMMWAAQLVTIGAGMEMCRVPVPRPGPGELLLKLESSGICHTDLHVRDGAQFPDGAPRPLTLGHEGIGVVVEQGEGARTPPGTRLGAPYLHDTCGDCRACLTGRESYCATHLAHGYNVQGTFAEYVIVKERYAVALPSSLDSLVSAPHMCAGVTAYGGVEKAGLAPGKNAVVIGCGGLGQYGIQLAKLTGANVIAIDTSSEKLEEARRLGADQCLLADKSAADSVVAMGGADAVINFAPSNRIWDMVPGMLNNFSTFVSVAMVAQPVPLVLEWLTFKDVTITGSSVGTRQQMRDFLRLADIHKIAVDIEAVPLAKANDAMNRLARGQVKGRFVVDFSRAP